MVTIYDESSQAVEAVANMKMVTAISWMRNEEHIVRLDTSTLYFISHANVVGSEVALCQQQRGKKMYD